MKLTLHKIFIKGVEWGEKTGIKRWDSSRM